MLNKAADEIIIKAEAILKKKQRIMVAIDGRCASGKTTLCGIISERTDCCVVHADDFFLRTEQRTPERFTEIGGNIDYERIRDEVLIPFGRTGQGIYRPFSCRYMKLIEPVSFSGNMLVIEGSYSMHPALWEYYDLSVFMTTPPPTQLRRLKERSPKLIDRFMNEWIPMEEKYFNGYNIAEKSDMIIET